MKAGTAQKMVLNMLTTSSMILLGKIKGNKMIDMQLSNHKLIARGELMLIQELNIDQETASKLLQKYKNVRTALINYKHEH
jgi:N-acetylmuramic acid 6-phosphate etherase